MFASKILDGANPRGVVVRVRNYTRSDIFIYGDKKEGLKFSEKKEEDCSTRILNMNFLLYSLSQSFSLHIVYIYNVCIFVLYKKSLE